MLRVPRRVVAALCLIPFFVGSAFAEEESASEVVETIVVKGVRTGVLSDDPSAFASSIDVDSLVAEQKQLADVLAETQGVQIRRFGGPGDRAEISIRGFASSQVVVVLDDVRLNPSRGGGVDLSSIPIDLLESVEVARGGGAATAGSGAMGGVVRLRMRRPGAGSETRFRGSGGSHDTWQGSLSTSAPGEIVDYAMGYSFFRTQGDFIFQRPSYLFVDTGKKTASLPPAKRLNNEQEKHTATVTLGRQIGEAGYLTVSEILSYSSGGQPGFDNGIATDAGQQADAHLRQVFSSSRIGWEEVPLDPIGAELEGSVSYRFGRSRFKNPQPTFGDPFEHDVDDATAALTLTSKWHPNFFDLENHFAVDFGASWDTFDASDQKNRRRESLYGVVRGDVSFFEKTLHITSALRLDWTRGFSQRWIPSLGAVWWPLPWLRFKGNAERSFRVPSFEELFLPDRGSEEGNPNLNPEQANNFDIGLELLFDEMGPLEELRFEAAYFYSGIQNSIVWVRANTRKLRPRNTDDAKSKGWELVASLRLGHYLTVSANHTIVDATFDRGGQRLPGRADQETNLRVGIRDPDLWKIVGELQRTGSITVTFAGGIKLPARKVWNASAGVNLAQLVGRWGMPLALDRLWVSASVNNIGDQSVRDALSFPQPGRTVSFALEGGW